MFKSIIISIALVFVQPALAATTEWQQIAPGAQLRLISSDVLKPDGTMMVALDVRLDPGIKTYWRVPGETGIPVQLDFAGSSGVTESEILWPLPIREQADGYTDHVYYGDVTFPIRLTLAGDDAHLNVAILMGVCSDICVPVSSTLDLTPAIGTRDIASDISIRQALASVPLVWTNGPAPIGNATYDANSNNLILADVSENFDLAKLIASTADPSIVFAAPQKSPNTGLITLERLGWGELSDLTGETVSLVFQSTSGPYLVERVMAGIEQEPRSD